jgi:ParB/RepB/Spo0J family partition protein
MKIPVDKIQSNPMQPRKNFSLVEIRELAESIHLHGLITPILVEPAGDNTYTLIAGERRLRAHQHLGLTEIEAVVRPASNERNHAILALIENLHRADLSPSEQGRAFQALRELGMSNNAIAHQVGVSLPTVSSRLALLELEPEILDMIDAGTLPVDQRAVKALQDVPATQRVEFARRLSRPGLSIKAVQRAAERYRNARMAERLGDGDPALTYAVQRSGAPDLPKWDGLTQLGKLPPWSLAVAAARWTCDTCELRGEASPVVCNRCPAVVILARMIEAASGRTD